MADRISGVHCLDLPACYFKRPMELIAQYKTISARATTDLDLLVNAAIGEGFQPFGGPYALNNFLCQALTTTQAAPKLASAGDL